MMERPNPDDGSDSPPDDLPGEEPAPKPRDPQPHNPQVTPLDEGKNLKKGIKVNET